jgi:CheY-like chemotaxis protein
VAGVVPVTRRILVVDDDPLLREVAQAALELVGGWEVYTAQSGPQAQQRALTEHPDAILLDVMMPGVDGPSTVAVLRADPATRDIPIIFLTAKMPSEDQEEWRPLRLAGVIPKPFDPMTLAADMASLLGWAEATR